MFCGFSYYTYIMNKTEILRFAMIKENSIWEFAAGAVILIVFFIAGRTIYPLIGVIKFCFFSKLEDKLDYYKFDRNALAVKLKKIKMFFIWLTFVNICAYVQLFIIVYLTGVNKNLITEILFAIGSVLPLMMFLSCTILYKGLYKKVNMIADNNEVPPAEGVKFDTGLWVDILTILANIIPIVMSFITSIKG